MRRPGEIEDEKKNEYLKCFKIAPSKQPTGGLRSFFFVVWQGIYDPGQTQQKDGDQRFFLLSPQHAVLPRSGAGSDRVEPAPCFVIQNCQTYYSSRCPMYGTC